MGYRVLTKVTRDAETNSHTYDGSDKHPQGCSEKHTDCFWATTAKLSCCMRDYIWPTKSKIPTIWSFIGKVRQHLSILRRFKSWFLDLLAGWLEQESLRVLLSSCIKWRYQLSRLSQETVKIEWNEYISTTEPVLNASPSSSSLSDDKTRDQRSYMWSRITVTQLKSTLESSNS